MRSHVLLNLLNELMKRDKRRGFPSVLSLFFATSLIKSTIQKQESMILFIILYLDYFEISFLV